MKGHWFTELINPWNDPRLIAAIDRSKQPAIKNEGRRAEDERCTASQPVTPVSGS